MHETFTVGCYANTILIGFENVTLSSGNSTTTVFLWNTTGSDHATYTMITNASAVPGELSINLDDNIYINGTVFVTFPGDIDYDGDVDFDDFIIFGRLRQRHIGCKPSSLFSTGCTIVLPVFF